MRNPKVVMLVNLDKRPNVSHGKLCNNIPTIRNVVCILRIINFGKLLIDKMGKDSIMIRLMRIQN